MTLSGDYREANLIKICASLGIGNPLGNPQPVAGGLLHKMWRLETDMGIFAVKVLNSEIMSRADAKLNYRVSERVAEVASKNGINAVPAKTNGREPWFEFDGQYMMVFDWIDGGTLEPERCTAEHCRTIGELLFQIHNLDVDIEGFDLPTVSTASEYVWNPLIENARSKIGCWGLPHESLLQDVSTWSKLHQASLDSLPPELVISHRDLDFKNVIWKQETVPDVIDWESVGYINPTVELVEVAFNWSQGVYGGANKTRFQSVIDAYIKAGGKLPGRVLDAVYASLGSMLGWLEYNMRRSLNEDVFNVDERELGHREVLKTMDELKKFTDAAVEYADWITELG